MKKILLILLAVGGMGISDSDLLAADTNNIATDLGGIIARVNEKLEQGKNAESDLAGNLVEFDALYARHKGEKSEAVIQILLAKINLYLQVLHEPEKAINVLKQVKHDFPESQINGNTDMLIEKLQKMAEGKKTQASLVVGTSFPDFNEKDLAGNPLSVSSLKGKVVLIDFWATWCPICKIEMPGILATYKKYHDQGFEIIGISQDEDQQKLETFLKKQGLPWPQYDDGKDDKLALKYGVELLPTTFLLDRNGIIIGKNLRGDELEAAVAKIFAKK